jgi:hypothetical protein
MNIRGTTILAVKHNGMITVAGDGQVTLDTTILKHGARKVRRLYNMRLLLVLPAPRLTRSLYSTVSIRSWNNITAIC